MLTLDPETWNLIKDLIAAVLVAVLSLLGYDRLIAKPRVDAARRDMAREARARRTTLR